MELDSIPEAPQLGSQKSFNFGSAADVSSTGSDGKRKSVRKRATNKDSAARDARRKTRMEAAAKAAELNRGVGMRAALSVYGGSGCNLVPCHDSRYDGQRQEGVIRDLREQLQALKDQKSLRGKDKGSDLNLSALENLQNRVKDLENWFGKDEAPRHLVEEFDPHGQVRARYDGEFAEEEEGVFKRHGHAAMRTRDGMSFVGMFEDGTPHGEGKIVFATGDKWEGNFDAGRLHGFGVFTWQRPEHLPPGLHWRKAYMGFLEDGRVDCQGRKSTYVFNKDVYEGEFRNGVAHGKGVYLWEDGHYYDGEWVNGRAEGVGVLVDREGNRQKAYWEPCSAKWYVPLKVSRRFWPGQIPEAEGVKTFEASQPAYLRPA